MRRAGSADIALHRIILLALPVDRLEPFLRRHGARITPGAFVADVSAVKERPLRWMKSHLPADVAYTGLHPLFGPDSARKTHRGHSIVVCRGRTTDACHRRLLSILKQIGLKPVETDPITHDKTMASTLFMTQWIGRLAISCGLNRSFPFETPSFQYLRFLMDRAANDHRHTIRDLHRFSRYPRIIVKKVRDRIGSPFED